MKIKQKKFIHADDRRTLISFGEGHIWKSCKLIIFESNSEIGNHYHKIKTEGFYLIQGSGKVIIDKKSYEIASHLFFIIEPGQVHSFIMEKYSILLGLSTEVYDPKDEYKP